MPGRLEKSRAMCSGLGKTGVIDMKESESVENAAGKKERSYFFDAFRGLLIWTIPISHFMRIGGGFEQRCV